MVMASAGGRLALAGGRLAGAVVLRREREREMN